MRVMIKVFGSIDLTGWRQLPSSDFGLSSSTAYFVRFQAMQKQVLDSTSRPGRRTVVSAHRTFRGRSCGFASWRRSG